MDLRTEIPRYVDEKGEEGCSWSELEIRFVSKSQLLESLKKRSRGKGKHSKGAFVNAMKDLQRGKEPCVKKILVKGSPRYIITLRGKSELGKKDITQGIINQELIEIELPSNFIYDFFFSRIKSQVDVARGLYTNPLKRLKLTGKKEEFYGNFSARILAQLYSKYFKINISHPKGQKPPNLDIFFDEKNITSGKELLVSYFAHVVGEYEKEMGKMLPFHLLLTFNHPTSSHEDFRKELESQIETLYQKWLLEFDQQHSEKTKNEFHSELIKYTGQILKKRHKALQKS